MSPATNFILLGALRVNKTNKTDESLHDNNK